MSPRKHVEERIQKAIAEGEFDNLQELAMPADPLNEKTRALDQGILITKALFVCR